MAMVTRATRNRRDPTNPRSLIVVVATILFIRRVISVTPFARHHRPIPLCRPHGRQRDARNS